MGLNDTPSSERLHIGIFGKRNSGKSSIINAITNQNLAIVSDVLGTTTDPVYKSMELLPIGPVVLIDTPGIDDIGELGQLRIEKTYEVLDKIHVALVVVDSSVGTTLEDKILLNKIKQKELPYIVVMNKSDLDHNETADKDTIYVSCSTCENITKLKEMIGSKFKNTAEERQLIGDLLKPSDVVILVVPIDKAAPKGRLILPQQQTIRDILDSDCRAIVIKENEVRDTIAMLNKKPRLVVTDSQAFERVAKDTPDDIELTSFSILFARYKGILDTALSGARFIDKLKDNDTVLISEGCTHHRQCDDIGTVKLPKLLKNRTGMNINFEFTSGREFPKDLNKYSMVIHCGGCMLNDKEVQSRYETAEAAGIPITNYGLAIAHMKGILERSVAPF